MDTEFLRPRLDAIQAQLVALNRQIGELRGEIAELCGEAKGDIVAMRGEMKGEIGALLGQFGGTRGEIKVLHTEIQTLGMKVDVSMRVLSAGIRRAEATLSANFRRMEGTVDAHLAGMKDSLAAMNDKIESTRCELLAEMKAATR